MTLIIKQYSTQKNAQAYCDRIRAELMRQAGPDAYLDVNELDSNVFQVEINFVGKLPKELDLLLLDRA